MILTERDRETVAAAIAAAEKATSGEIFCVLARASDDYRFIPLAWAALAALAVPGPLIVATLMSAQAIFLVQLAIFLALALVMQWWPVRIRVVPAAVRRGRAHRHALEQFLAHGLHTTEGRTGVLVFLSLAERYGEVVADEGIYREVDPAVWDEAVAALLAGAAAGQPARGFADAVAVCGKVLARHFPPAPGDRDELPNRLVEL